MKRIVVASSFPGDAHIFLTERGIDPRKVLIATPSTSHKLEGLNGNLVETFWDIRRVDSFSYSDRLGKLVDRLTVLYPAMNYRVMPW